MQHRRKIKHRGRHVKCKYHWKVILTIFFVSGSTGYCRKTTSASNENPLNEHRFRFSVCVHVMVIKFSNVAKFSIKYTNILFETIFRYHKMMWTFIASNAMTVSNLYILTFQSLIIFEAVIIYIRYAIVNIIRTWNHSGNLILWITEHRQSSWCKRCRHCCHNDKNSSALMTNLASWITSVSVQIMACCRSAPNR